MPRATNKLELMKEAKARFAKMEKFIDSRPESVQTARFDSCCLLTKRKPTGNMTATEEMF